MSRCPVRVVTQNKVERFPKGPPPADRRPVESQKLSVRGLNSKAEEWAEHKYEGGLDSAITTRDNPRIVTTRGLGRNSFRSVEELGPAVIYASEAVDHTHHT